MHVFNVYWPGRVATAGLLANMSITFVAAMRTKAIGLPRTSPFAPMLTHGQLHIVPPAMSMMQKHAGYMCAHNALSTNPPATDRVCSRSQSMAVYSSLPTHTCWAGAGTALSASWQST